MSELSAINTVRDVVRVLLRDLGVTDFNPETNSNNRNGPGLGSGDISACCHAINGALKEIYKLAPASLSEKPITTAIRAPKSVTLDVTQYSTATSCPDFESWMFGCTVRIDGEEFDNEFTSNDALQRPVLRTSATAVSATVYCDAIRISGDYSHVLEPVVIPDVARLLMCSSGEEFRSYSTSPVVTTPRTIGSGTSSVTARKQVGEPTVCFVDVRYDPVSYGSGIQSILRLNPMPGRDFPLDYRVKVKPTKVTPANVENGVDYTTDPAVTFPIEWLDSVLVPMARLRLSSDPLFKNKDGLPELRRQYEVAKAILEEITPVIARQKAHYPSIPQ